MRKLDRIGGVVAVALAAACGSSQSASPPGDGGDDGTSSGASGSGGGSGGASSGSSGASGSGGAASSGGASSGASSSGASSSGASSSSGGDGGTAGYDFSVYQHHKNGTRNGVYIEPTFSSTAVATMHKTTFMGTATTLVYAQPLYVENGPGGPVFIVVTEQNNVTALNASTGAAVWTTGPMTLGQPVTGGLPCGNIPSPSTQLLGITGTPFIDFSSGQGVIYFDAMTTPDNNTTAKHLVYALKLSDGTVLPNWPVDMNAKVTSFTSRTQNQRGALQLVNGVLYVPYGGLWGDCGTYYGWVVGIPLATPQSPVAWHTTAQRGGIWASGSLPTDGTSIFPVTGNTTGVTFTNWGGGEAVIRLGAGPTFSGATKDYYAPTNWPSLDGTDGDLGGGNDVLFDMPGTAKPHLIAQGGKDGYLYVLDRDNLGGIGPAGGPGTELLKLHVSTGEINGAPAVYTTSMGTYVAFHTSGAGIGCPNTGGTGNVVVAKIVAGSSITASVAWCSSKGSLGSPMVTTTDGTANAVVWAANSSLWGFDGNTGALVAGGTNTGMGTAIESFNTPIAAHGKLAVGVNGALYVFTP